MYGNLFKGGVVSGIGANRATAGIPRRTRVVLHPRKPNNGSSTSKSGKKNPELLDCGLPSGGRLAASSFLRGSSFLRAAFAVLPLKFSCL